jgi:hypothetical protein
VYVRVQEDAADLERSVQQRPAVLAAAAILLVGGDPAPVLVGFGSCPPLTTPSSGTPRSPALPHLRALLGMRAPFN